MSQKIERLYALVLTDHQGNESILTTTLTTLVAPTIMIPWISADKAVIEASREQAELFSSTYSVRLVEFTR